MKKKWLVIPIALVLLFVFWQMGGIDFFLARTIFAPDQNPDSQDEGDGLDNDELDIGKLDYDIEVIGENFEIPWEIVPLPDGRLLVTERPGRVVMLDGKEVNIVLDVEHTGEGGLLGMEISPDFKDSNHLFLYYTYSADNQTFNRVSRFTLEENALVDEVYILDKIPGSRFHNGGRLKFGPDEKLYITTGDAQNPELSQDLDSLAGKILRINPDGSIPADNPFEDSPVFAYGFRNPQGIAWHPVSGDLFASDHGPDSQDEINRILPGKNYGWPVVTCLDGDTEYEDPISCYSEFTLAPSGIAIDSWDQSERSHLYVAGLRGNMVMRMELDDKGGYVRQEELFRDYGRIRTIVHYEGALYAATNNRDGRGVPKENDDVVLKITPIFPSTK
ncbi:PQQ-dependent sugar dehydrogenase [Alkalibacter rhizosphaerae]|uniref:PQQ-dependent sugar dehydrogenase n=1 Tax=Alkalibacter rhizosphaerae TaxID=2815577 RepID=A0A974XEI6_9FIRM|nr:PQQ-dependent sugar dehydrogenase [Alkalibacter rhizosphaerae]QSX08226.1 PQQ-dependent sugar dehydrogenase [Alkalibacter rhizosphaerae]